MRCFYRRENIFAGGSLLNLLVLVLNILLRASATDGIGILGNNQRRVGPVISIQVLEAAVSCEENVSMKEERA